MTNKQFIEQVAKCVIKYAKQYSICVHSPIIAQAILESNWGNSKLASKYHNYFGLKCGTKWTGKSVNMRTQEEYRAGVFTTIKDNFRVYDSMEEGIKGYFDFISTPRYEKLKKAKDYLEYADFIKECGYATSSSYVTSLTNLVNLYNLTVYDKKESLKSNFIVACEVINGLWGIGEDRKNRLTKAGYDYEIIQRIVNYYLR